MNLSEQETRGRNAAELLDNELLKEALAAIESEVVEQWTDCPARDKEGKEALWQLMKTQQKFKAILTGYIENGKLATAQLKQFEEKRKLRDMLKRA